MSSVDDHEQAIQAAIEEEDSKMVPNLAFTPDPRNTVYNPDYDDRDNDTAQDITDRQDNFMSILKVNLDDIQ